MCIHPGPGLCIAQKQSEHTSFLYAPVVSCVKSHSPSRHIPSRLTSCKLAADRENNGSASLVFCGPRCSPSSAGCPVNDAAASCSVTQPDVQVQIFCLLCRYSCLCMGVLGVSVGAGLAAVTLLTVPVFIPALQPRALQASLELLSFRSRRYPPSA